MKKIVLSIIAILLILTGCGNSPVVINGKELIFDKVFKDNYITYNYPSTFNESEDPYFGKDRKTYELNDENNKTIFRLKVEQYSLILSFGPMEEDAKKIENDKNNKNLNREVIKVNGKNLVKYSFNKADEFGDNTLYYVYYGGYSYMGVNEYIKITMMNIEGKEDFEKAFLASFKINH